MAAFDSNCTACPRLAAHLATVRRDYPAYHARPVAPFGDPDAHLIIVGLAPGMHGANATGRPFTGDYAGILLYETLYKFGFSNQAQSQARDDGLRLQNCRITNAVKCLPPENKPRPDEVARCNGYLQAELSSVPAGSVILALGRIAHDAVRRSFGLKASELDFAHGARHALPDARWLIDSYHCSRYNTQTRRLTTDMFEAIFTQIRGLLPAGIP